MIIFNNMFYKFFYILFYLLAQLPHAKEEIWTRINLHRINFYFYVLQLEAVKLVSIFKFLFIAHNSICFVERVLHTLAKTSG